MKYENAKSLILTILVLLSIILSWNILTFQPNNDVKQSNYVEEINISKKLNVSEIIKPYKAIYHDHNDSHRGSWNMGNINLLMNEILNWTFYDFTLTEPVNHLDDIIHGPNRIELIFPSSVPYEIFKNVINVDSKNVPSGSFERMIISKGEFQGDEGVIYFISPEKNEVIKSLVRSPLFKRFDEVLNEVLQNFQSFTVFQKPNGQSLYILNEEMVLPKYRFYPQYIPLEEFKKALFPNPEFVTRSDNEYTDSSSLLNVNEPVIEYVDPTNRHQILTPSELLQKGINFINSHGGWTDTYIFDDLRGNNVSFRLYLHDYFVMNESGLANISLSFDNKWFKYKRTYLKWDISIPQYNSDVVLVPGERVIQFLEKNKSININEVQDIAVGFYLTKNNNDQLYQLEPSWFYRTNGTWKRITPEELGGILHGLE